MIINNQGAKINKVINMNSPKLKPCHWQDNGATYGTECKHVHSFISGMWWENDFKYCPYCGGLIVEIKENKNEN